MILVPAYGRDYKTAAAVKKDWEANKDFRIGDISMGRWDGAYINKAQYDTGVEQKHKTGSYIRYNKLTELTHIGQWEEADDE